MLKIHRVNNNEIDEALAVLLNAGGQIAGDSPNKVVAFKDMARRERYDLSRQIVVTQDDRVIFTCCFIPHQGGSAFLFTSNCSSLSGADKEFAVEALRQMRQWACDDGCNLLQLLLETDDIVSQEICLRSGFRQLTELLYLYRLMDNPIPRTSLIKGVSWQGYDQQHHELFKHVVSQTYVDSLDCPELEGLRTMDETIEAHMSAGEFDPSLWKILLLNDEPAGVMLLSALSDKITIELTYMGLLPQVHGQGLGKYLLKSVLAEVLKHKKTNITLAVDSRNHIAVQLYRKYGFKDLFRRNAIYYSSRW